MNFKYFFYFFDKRRAALLAKKAQGAENEEPDEHRKQSVFWVPPEARWRHRVREDVELDLWNGVHAEGDSGKLVHMNRHRS